MAVSLVMLLLLLVLLLRNNNRQHVQTRLACFLQHVRCVAAGGHHTVAVTDTSVCAWGSNSCGQLGTRTFMDKAAPTEIKELEGVGVDTVTCGAQHTLFLCRYANTSCPAPDTPHLHT